MAFVLFVIASLAATAVSLAWRLVLRRRRERSEPRDDTIRVGDDVEQTPHEAARRAGDSNSWMIPSGF